MLIYILVIVLILFLGNKYILMPTYTNWNNLKLQKEELELKKFEMEQKISNVDSLKTEIEKINFDISELAKDISPFLNDEDADNMLTSLCIFHNLKPINLNIRSNDYKKINLKALSEQYKNVNDNAIQLEGADEVESDKNAGVTENTLDTKNTNPGLSENLEMEKVEEEVNRALEEASKEEEIHDFYIRTAYVTMEFEGNMGSMLDFIDDVNKTPYLSVLEYSSVFSDERQELFQHKAVIKIIMINT